MTAPNAAAESPNRAVSLRTRGSISLRLAKMKSEGEDFGDLYGLVLRRVH